MATLIVALIQGARPFYGDSGYYWELSATFNQAGHFSLLNFSSPLRGYVFPLVIYALKTFAEGVDISQSAVAELLNILLYALIGAVLAPRLAEAAWPDQRWGVLRRVALTALLLFFWHGDLNYPLTDFPGLAMAFLTLVAIAQPDSPAWMFVAGFAAAMAINMRPAYAPLLPVTLVLLGLAWFDQRGSQHAPLARRMLCAGLLAIGFAAVSLPQSLVSHHYYNTWSFIPGTAAHLAEEQLRDGMIDQRFDGFEFPHAPGEINYVDETSLRLLKQQPGVVITSTSQYMGLFVTHPIAMVTMLFRHIVNGLDVRYSTIYIEHYDAGGQVWLRLTGFLLVFLALVRLLWAPARRGLGRIRWRYPLALSLCCLTSIAARIETRYLLPIYLLCYMLVLAPGWVNPIGPADAGLRRFRTPAVLAVAYLAFMALVWHVVGNLQGKLS